MSDADAAASFRELPVAAAAERERFEEEGGDNAYKNHPTQTLRNSISHCYTCITSCMYLLVNKTVHRKQDKVHMACIVKLYSSSTGQLSTI
jgi:hypothetical protein